MRLRDLFAHFSQMKHHFISVGLIFTVGCVIGFGYAEQFAAVLEAQMEGLQELAQKLHERDSKLWLFGFIFLNNASKAILMVFAGAFFGIFPVFALLINGMMIGYLGHLHSEAGMLGYFFTGILPHGIIEIPAILLACAYGIKLGGAVLKGMSRMLNKPDLRSAGETRQLLKLSIPLAIVLVGALLVAAAIESTITPWLLGI